MRCHPEHLAFLSGSPNGRAEIAGWIRFADGREPDVRALAVFSDSFPPSTVNLELDVDRAPTLELTVHVRARPAAGWLRGSFRTEAVAGGYLVEDGELWDEGGILVAQSRQLALVPRS
jgi:acyl-CoA thioesterase